LQRRSADVDHFFDLAILGSAPEDPVVVHIETNRGGDAPLFPVEDAIAVEIVDHDADLAIWQFQLSLCTVEGTPGELSLISPSLSERP